MHVVKETEGDSLAVGAVLGAIDVVVPELRVGHVDVYRVFCRVFAEVCGEGYLAQHEARAVGLAPHEGDFVPLGAECGVDRVYEVGEVQLVLVRVAHRNVEVGVPVLVAVLECHVGENRAFFRGVVHVDALVEPGLLRAEPALRVVVYVDGGIAFLFLNGNHSDFDTVNFFVFLRHPRGGGDLIRDRVRGGPFLRHPRGGGDLIRDRVRGGPFLRHPRGGGDLIRSTVLDFCAIFRLFQRHLENRAVEPRPTKIRYAVEVFARNYGEVLPEGICSNLRAFDERPEGILLRLVCLGDFLFPRFVEFLLANPENFLECPVERHAVGFRKFRPDFRDSVFAVVPRDVEHEREPLRVGPEFGKKRVVRKVVHVFEREQAVIEGRDAQQHVAVAVPGVKAHAGGFKLRRTFGEPQRLQREGEERREVARDALVVVVGVAELYTVDAWLELAPVFDAYQVAEFVRDDVGEPAVAAADLEIPVGEPQVHCVFARDGATVTIESVVEHCVHAARQVLLVAAHHRIVDCFCICGKRGGVLGVFLRVDELEVLRVCGLPLDVALVAVETGRKGGTRKQQCACKCSRNLSADLFRVEEHCLINLGNSCLKTHKKSKKRRAVARTALVLGGEL